LLLGGTNPPQPGDTPLISIAFQKILVLKTIESNILTLYSPKFRQLEHRKLVRSAKVTKSPSQLLYLEMQNKNRLQIVTLWLSLISTLEERIMEKALESLGKLTKKILFHIEKIFTPHSKLKITHLPSIKVKALNNLVS
jgi:hypothetical protein